MTSPRCVIWPCSAACTDSRSATWAPRGRRRCASSSWAAPEVGFATTVAQMMIGITAHWRGQPAAGRRALAEAVRHARQTDNRLATAYALGYLALGALEVGALEEAGRAVPVALDAAEEPDVAEHFVAAIPHLAAAALTPRPDVRRSRPTTPDGRSRSPAAGAGRLEVAAALGAGRKRERPSAATRNPNWSTPGPLARTCRRPRRGRPAAVPHPTTAPGPTTNGSDAARHRAEPP